MITSEVIKSGDIVLKTLSAANMSSDYHTWLNDPEINQYLESRFEVQTQEMVSAFVNKCNEGSNALLMGIFLKDKHIGNIKAEGFTSVHRKVSIGLIIGDKSCWGKGFASKAIASFTEFIFSHYQIDKITAGMYEGNIASEKAFKLCGYFVEGIRKKDAVLGDKRVDVTLMARLKEGI